MENEYNDQFADYLGTSEIDFSKITTNFDYRTTRYYSDLIRKHLDEGNTEVAMSLLRSVLPDTREIIISGDVEDGVGENQTANGNPFISQFYDNRILLLLNNRCPLYCRYCFRRSKLGPNQPELTVNDIDATMREVHKMINISGSNINEIVISGGEPLMLGKVKLRRIMAAIEKMPQIRGIRFDTKMLAVNPGIITELFLKQIQTGKSLRFVNHFIHSTEITEIVAEKIKLLSQNNIQIAAHIPILNGINDTYPVIKDLVENLYFNGIQPYYLIHYIPTKWTEHFRIPLVKSLQIFLKLKRSVSGLALPALIVYLPDGSGKAIISDEDDLKKVSGGYLLCNTKGDKVFYEE